MLNITTIAQRVSSDSNSKHFHKAQIENSTRGICSLILLVAPSFSIVTPLSV